MNKSYPEIMEDVLFDKIEAEASTYDAESVAKKLAVPYERTKTD